MNLIKPKQSPIEEAKVQSTTSKFNSQHLDIKLEHSGPNSVTSPMQVMSRNQSAANILEQVIKRLQNL